MANNRTHLSRAARKLQAATNLTYQQALTRLRASGEIPNLDDPATVAAFIAATNGPDVVGTTGPVPAPTEVTVVFDAYSIDDGDIFLYSLFRRDIITEDDYRKNLWAKGDSFTISASHAAEVLALPDELELSVDVRIDEPDASTPSDDVVWADEDGEFLLADGAELVGCDSCGVEDAVVRVEGRYLCELHAGDNGLHRPSGPKVTFYVESGNGERLTENIDHELTARSRASVLRERLIRVVTVDGQDHTELVVDYAAADPDGIGAWQCDECHQWINEADINLGNHQTHCSMHPDNIVGYCEDCQVQGHDVCSMTSGCPCCDRTRAQLDEDGASLNAGLRSHANHPHIQGHQILHCAECGETMFVDDTGVSHHVDDDNLDGIDYDADADHVAIDDGERDCARCGQSFNLEEGGEEFIAELGGPRCLSCETGEGTMYCRLCHKAAGPDYHIGGVFPPDENNIVCDDCWDERLR